MMKFIYPIAAWHVSLLMLLFGIAFRLSSRNRVFGIRTARTLASDENWKEVHTRAARPTIALAAAGMAVAALGFAFEPMRAPVVFWSVLTVQLANLLRFTLPRGRNEESPRA